METTYKPQSYNSLSPYLIVDHAEKLVEVLSVIFDAEELRRFNHENGTIAHIELKLDDSVLMLSNSTKEYPAQKATLHMYVPDVFKTFQRAVDQGCTVMEAPVNKEGDPDTRGAFLDPAGNYWAVGTQH